MKKRFLKKVMVGLLALCMMATAKAGTPLWTFIPLTNTQISVPGNGTATVKYQVTNQSKKTYPLVMTPILGITQVTTAGNCPNPFTLAYQQSCVLNLEITGNALQGNVAGGPMVCQKGNGLQCYQPNQANSLRITKEAAEYTVGGSVYGLTGTLILQNNGGNTLTRNADGVFAFSNPLSTGNTYSVTIQSQPAIQTCTVSHGNGAIGNANITDVGVTCVTHTTTLSTSVNTLALSVTGLTEYGISGTPSSGVSRLITITNTGSYPANNLSIDYPAWPTGTTTSSTCGATLAASGTCTITITPGATASSNGTSACTNGTAPVTGNLSISADNASTVSTQVVVLGYGCLYQGGYVFAFDDTTANTASVGGKVVTTSDQASPYPDGIIWSSNSSGDYDNGVSLYGISETSTTSSPNPGSGQVSGQTACNGATDGVCDTTNIVAYYSPPTTSPAIDYSYYAAGLCKQSIGGYSDWYLPAICEMGYDTDAAGTGCGSSGSPLLQNMQSGLVDYGSLNLLSGFYWSASEYSGSTTITAWAQDFFSGGSSSQNIINKVNNFGVRCARGF